MVERVNLPDPVGIELVQWYGMTWRSRIGGWTILALTSNLPQDFDLECCVGARILRGPLLCVSREVMGGWLWEPLSRPGSPVPCEVESPSSPTSWTLHGKSGELQGRKTVCLSWWQMTIEPSFQVFLSYFFYCTSCSIKIHLLQSHVWSIGQLPAFVCLGTFRWSDPRSV